MFRLRAIFVKSRFPRRTNVWDTTARVPPISEKVREPETASPTRDSGSVVPTARRETRALPGKKSVQISAPKENAGRQRGVVIRHFVDVQQRLNCALPSFSLSLDFFRCRGLHGMSADFSAGLAVDLSEISNFKFEISNFSLERR